MWGIGFTQQAIASNIFMHEFCCINSVIVATSLLYMGSAITERNFTMARGTFQEYPSDPLRKISALQTKVELAGNLRNKQNLAENLAYRELASWKIFFGVQIAYTVVLQISSGWKLHSGCDR